MRTNTKDSVILASILAVSVLAAGCPGVHGSGKITHLKDGFMAPDIVGLIPAHNHSNDMRAIQTVMQAVAMELTRMGYVSIYSPAQKRQLREFGMTDGGQINAFKWEELAKVLGVESLAYTNINEFNEVNLGFYQHRKVEFDLALESEQGEKLWMVEGKTTNRVYNLSPQAAAQAFVQTAVTSALEKAFNVHMVQETNMAANYAAMKMPGWPEIDPKKVKRLEKEARKNMIKSGEMPKPEK